MTKNIESTPTTIGPGKLLPAHNTLTVEDELNLYAQFFHEDAADPERSSLWLQQLKKDRFGRGYPPFEIILRDYIGITPSEAYPPLWFARTVNLLSPEDGSVEALVPTKMGQVRSLLKLAADDDIRTAWARACAEARYGEVGVARVQNVVSEMLKNGAERAPRARITKELPPDVRRKGRPFYSDLPPKARFPEMLAELREFAATPEFAAMPEVQKKAIQDDLALAANTVAKTIELSRGNR